MRIHISFYFSSISPSLLNIIANPLVDSNFERIIVITAMIGTERNAHIIHHKLDQNNRERIIIVEERFNLFHIILGSKKLPEIV